MDKERFDALCLQEQAADGGIGTLGEKRLHRVLKTYFEPRAACREQPFAGYVADILNEEGVTEVQTRNYGALRKKLDAFLPLGPVRVVCPLPARKWISWVDPATGEISARRPSPKHGAPIDAFYSGFLEFQIFCCLVHLPGQLLHIDSAAALQEFLCLSGQFLIFRLGNLSPAGGTTLTDKKLQAGPALPNIPGEGAAAGGKLKDPQGFIHTFFRSPRAHIGPKILRPVV